jgi:hypothetical protein
MMMVRRIALAVGLMLLGRVALSAAPLPEIINGAVYNFWQDADHVRGIWRTTTIADYVSATPSWTTVLDLDALASTEKKNWVWEGADCDSPSTTRCLIFLSDGGADATTVREFDLTTERFVDDGFVLPTGKQNVAWADENTLLVAREWTPGDLTRSSYPYIVKRVTRGQPLTEAADVFAGTKDDVRAGPFELRDGSGHRVLFIDEGTSFFDHRSFVVTSAGVEPIAMPAKAHIAGLVAGQVLITLDEPWRLGTKVIPSGSLASVDLAALLADPQHLQPVAVYVPGPRESLATLATTRGQVLITLLDNVRGRAAIYTPVGGGWSHRALPLPDDVALDLVSANEDGADVMLTVSGFLTPTTLYRVDADAGTASAIKARRRRTARGDLEGRHAHPLLSRASEEHALRRYDADDSRRVRGLRRVIDAVLQRHARQAVARTWWGLRARQHSWWRRVWTGVARRGAEDASPGDLRRLRGGRSRPDRASDHEPAPSRDRGRFERWPADGSGVRAASRSVERGADRGAAARHAALRADRGGCIVGRRIRQRVGARRARVSREDFAVREHQARRALSAVANRT